MKISTQCDYYCTSCQKPIFNKEKLEYCPYCNEKIYLFDCKKLFSCTHSRIIQENNPNKYEIIPITGYKHRAINENKKVLTFFENDIIRPIKKSNSCIDIEILNWNLFEYSNKYFTSFMNKINNKKIYVLVENLANKKRKFILVDSRFSPCYQKKVKKRMKWLIYKYGNTNSVTLVLTLDPKIYRNNKYEMWKNIKKELNRFLTDLKYYFKKKNLPFPKYICTIESQKGRPENNFIAEGNPHLHFVFLNCKRLLDWRKIKKLWGLGRIYINRTYDNHKIRHPINYITKYITKTFTKTNKENVLTQSLCWLFGIRSFSTSRGLIIPIKLKSLEKYRLICLVICNEDFDTSNLPDEYSPEFDFDNSNYDWG